MRNVLIWEVPSEQEEPGFSMPQVDKFVEETLRLSTRCVLLYFRTFLTFCIL